MERINIHVTHVTPYTHSETISPDGDESEDITVYQRPGIEEEIRLDLASDYREYRGALYGFKAFSTDRLLAQVLNIPFRDSDPFNNRILLYERMDEYYGNEGWEIPEDMPRHVGVILAPGDYAPNLAYLTSTANTDESPGNAWNWNANPWLDSNQFSLHVYCWINTEAVPRRKHDTIGPGGLMPHG